jgi:hypothetical protein
MTKVLLTVVGASFVVIVSFLATLRLIDHFGLFSSAPTVSLFLQGEEFSSTEGAYIIQSDRNYNVTYSSSGAESCELKYHNADDGSSGQTPARPNITETAASGLVGEYTLTCISSTGASTSKTITIRRSK